MRVMSGRGVCNRLEGTCWQMAELAGDEVGDGNQMAGGTVTSGLGLSGLNPTVGGLDAATIR